jgi:hypothetical protein
MLFGDAINGMLTGANPTKATQCVWNFLAGTAISHGLPEAELPSLSEMFAHVAHELGGPREGWPSTPPQHQPLAPAGQVLARVRTLATACLTGEFSKIAKMENRFGAAPTSYQVVTAWSAANILSQCCGVMPPKVALTLGMEAAIYASKLMTPPAQKSEA